MTPIRKVTLSEHDLTVAEILSKDIPLKPRHILWDVPITLNVQQAIQFQKVQTSLKRLVRNADFRLSHLENLANEHVLILIAEKTRPNLILLRRLGNVLNVENHFLSVPDVMANLLVVKDFQNAGSPVLLMSLKINSNNPFLFFLKYILFFFKRTVLRFFPYDYV